MTTVPPPFEGREIPGVAFHPLRSFTDARGTTSEIVRRSGIGWAMNQVVVSDSRKGVLRGLHVHGRQWDLWRVISGTVRVGLADLRDLESAGRDGSGIPKMLFSLSGNDPFILEIPPGVAHGYLAVTDAKLLYILSSEHDGTDEYGVAWNDPTLDLRWGDPNPILSPRDASAPPLSSNVLPDASHPEQSR